MQDSAPALATTAAVAPGRADILPVRFEQVGYSVGSTRIISGLDLSLGPGRPTVLMGPNGCGKTTLIKLAMGLLLPTEGTISFSGRKKAPHGSRALVFQKPVMLRRTVAANIAFALQSAGRSTNGAAIKRLLEIAHIGSLAERPARRLSGGEQQRLALARALAREPSILFLDEPTASLDPAATKIVEEIIASVAASGVKIVMSTHDIGQAKRLAHDVVFLAKGRFIEHTPAERFFSVPVSEEARRFLAGELVV